MLPRNVLAILVYVSLSAFASAAAPREIVVSPDGAAGFKSVAAAVDSVKDATEADPVNIRIRPGTYTETVTTRDWVNLIGEDRDKCIITYDGNVKEQVHQHTIWATSNTTLKNLTLIGQTVKYVIHSDGGGAYVLNIENCILRREYPTEQAKGYSAAFGIGLRGKQNIVMKDCLLEAILPIYWHNWNEQRGACSMTLEKCTLKSKDWALGIYMLGSRQHDFFVIHDCILQGGKGSIQYVNQRNVKGTTWDGQDEVTLIGSGNALAGISGTEMKDDSASRVSGVELARQAPIVPPAQSADGVRQQESYGTAQGRVAVPKMWSLVDKPGQYYLKMEATENSIVLTCPPAAENPEPFGYGGGPSGFLLMTPLTLEMRMKFTFAPGGGAQLYYCASPNAWLAEWQPGKICDGANAAASRAVDTTAWQTYRLVARSADDVRLMVVGVPGDGIPLKVFKHGSEYFQFRVCGHGSKVEIEHTKLLGTVPEK